MLRDSVECLPFGTLAGPCKTTVASEVWGFSSQLTEYLLLCLHLVASPSANTTAGTLQRASSLFESLITHKLSKASTQQQLHFVLACKIICTYKSLGVLMGK